MPEHISIRKDILEHILTDNIQNIVECSPDTCKLCYKGSVCNGEPESCVQYHLDDINRLYDNLEKQKGSD